MRWFNERVAFLQKLQFSYPLNRVVPNRVSKADDKREQEKRANLPLFSQIFGTLGSHQFCISRVKQGQLGTFLFSFVTKMARVFGTL